MTRSRYATSDSRLRLPRTRHLLSRPQLISLMSRPTPLAFDKIGKGEARRQSSGGPERACRVEAASLRWQDDEPARHRWRRFCRSARTGWHCGHRPRHGEARRTLKQDVATEVDDATWHAWALRARARRKPLLTAAKALDKREEARMKGYVGEACPECANFTLVRNGTCLKCETCGATTGCS